MRVLFLLAVLLPGVTANAAVATASHAEVAAAWQRYQTEADLLQPAYSFPYQHCFRQAASTHSLPITLLLAVARGESDFNPTARSKANAHGLMQILWPTTANHLGFRRLSELYVPCRNVDAGARYLKEMLARYKGDLHLALAAYNYGPERIPVGATRIPDGAVWYSSYIYRHLGYVLGDGQRTAPSDTPYERERKILLVEFAAPYRAEAFVAHLEQANPDVRLDWFRAGVGKFHVVMLYGSDSELARSRLRLAESGFPLD